MKQNNDFLPQGYEAPVGNANYMKFEKGENKFRIMSRPIIGWEDWKDNKPLRFAMDKKPAAPVDPLKKIKHFWAMVVWDYQKEAIRILEITQASIQSAITALTKDSDWGSPLTYDIKVIKSGDGMETEYQTNPVPHKAVAKDIQDAFTAKPCVLDKLYTGEDPFAV